VNGLRAGHVYIGTGRNVACTTPVCVAQFIFQLSMGGALRIVSPLSTRHKATVLSMKAKIDKNEIRPMTKCLEHMNSDPSMTHAALPHRTRHNAKVAVERI
jgi:hypothetical protein